MERNADQTTGSFDFDVALEPESPSGRPPSTARDLRWTSGVIALAAVLLLAFNASSLESWTSLLKPNGVTAGAHALAEAWLHTTERLKLSMARERVRQAWGGALAQRFPSASGDQGPDEAR